MPTYKSIQIWIKEKYNFTVQPCWIAEMKEISEIKVKKAWNRKSENRIKSCPENKKAAILDAFRHFNMIC